MKMMNHQRDGLALFLDAAPGHQLSQGLPGASHAMQPDFFLAAVFADRSFGAAAMACLFDTAGRQCQPGLSFALLDSIDTAHQAPFRW